MQVEAQQVVLRLKRLCPALNCDKVKPAAKLCLLNPFALQVFRSLNLCLSGTALCLSNQDLVVELMDCQRHFVICLTRLSLSTLHLSTTNTLSRRDLQQAGKWLHKLDYA